MRIPTLRNYLLLSMALASACSNEEPATARDATVDALDASADSASASDTTDVADVTVDAGTVEDIGLLDSSR